MREGVRGGAAVCVTRSDRPRERSSGNAEERSEGRETEEDAVGCDWIIGCEYVPVI